MAENYNFTYDDKQIVSFFDFVSRGKSRFVIINVITRRKYDPDLPKSQIYFANSYKRVRDGEHFAEEIHRFEVKKGLYYEFKKETGEKYHFKENAIGIYMVPNPSDSMKSVNDICKEHNKLTLDVCRATIEQRSSLENCVNSLQRYCNSLDVEFRSKQMANVHYDYLHLDIDVKTNDMLKQVRDFLTENNAERYVIIETKNGYHLLVDTTENKKIIENAHKWNVIRDKDIEVSICPKGSPIPVPGCYVGGFKIRLVEEKDESKKG